MRESTLFSGTEPKLLEVFVVIRNGQLARRVASSWAASPHAHLATPHNYSPNIALSKHGD